MTIHRRLPLCAASLALAMGLAPRDALAESYATCTGFIESLPAVITEQGLWCLRGDVSTGLTSGFAITLAANNITLDCNGFKIGGLSAGDGTETIGVYALNRLNATVRGCNVRGFLAGVQLSGGGGHRVAGNRFDNNTYVGAVVAGDGSIVEDNQIFDTGGSTAAGYLGSAFGVQTVGAVDVVDNTITHVVPAANEGTAGAFGIHLFSAFGNTIGGNRVQGLVSEGAGTSRGIYLTTSGAVIVRDNHVVASGSGDSGTGIRCVSGASRALGNVVIGFTTPIQVCRDDGNSL